MFGFSGEETGNDFADFLIGAPDTYGQASNGFRQDARSKYFGAYAQDSWMIRPNVTFNFGVRYEISQPFYDTKNRIQTFIPGMQSNLFPNAPTGWVFPGDPGIPPTISPTGYKNFAPRLGIAYSPAFENGLMKRIFGGSGKTSIRAGFGIFYSTNDELPTYWETGDAPFGLFYQSPALVYLEQPFKSRTSSNDPGQRFPIPDVPTTGSDIDFRTWMPISGSTVADRHNVAPRTTHYNFSVQRQLTGSTIFTLAYVGSQGHHLVTDIEANPGIASRCLMIRQLFIAAGNPGGGCGPGGEDSIYDINGQTFYGTRPFSVTSGRYLSQGILDFGGILPYATDAANSGYNSFQATLEKKAGALQLLAGYTWSKSIDNSSGFRDATNPYNPAQSRSLSAFDMTHNFVVSYVYTLPFSRLAHGGIGRKFLAGWQISGITRLTTGFPITLSESDDQSLCGCLGADHPNYNGQPIRFMDPKRSANHQYFAIDSFSPQELGVPGNANRRFFHGPGLNSTDLAIVKQTSISERFNLEFRAEAFNAFNHPQLGQPGGDINSANFGKVTSASSGRIGQLALKLRF